jgi:hypothetical protein
VLEILLLGVLLNREVYACTVVDVNEEDVQHVRAECVVEDLMVQHRQSSEEMVTVDKLISIKVIRKVP